MNPITQTIKAQLQEFDENFYEVMGCETDPNGTKNIYLIRNEDGEILNGIDFYDELKELKQHLAQSHIALLESVVGICNEKLEEICNCCGGEGKEIAGENLVSMDMAIDAGERGLEGTHHSYEYKDCRVCEGVSKNKINNQALQDILTGLQETLKELKNKK